MDVWQRMVVARSQSIEASLDIPIVEDFCND
jgi:hypothetical protein